MDWFQFIGHFIFLSKVSEFSFSLENLSTWYSHFVWLIALMNWFEQLEWQLTLMPYYVLLVCQLTSTC